MAIQTRNKTVRGAVMETLEDRQLFSTVYLQVNSHAYRTVQSAVNAVPGGSSNHYVIQIAAGTYNERVTVPRNKQYVTLQGLGSGRSTVIQSNGNNEPALTVSASNFTATNIWFQNLASTVQHDEAVYINTGSQRVEFQNCTIKGWQDTLYIAPSTLAYFASSDIYGTVDFIWGNGVGLFNQCNLYELGHSTGTIAAPATPSSQRYGFDFLNCTIAAAPGATVAAGSTYLDRPWGPNGEASFINCRMSNIINSAGWLSWGTNQNTARANEYGSKTLSGATINLSSRASWVKRLTSSQAGTYTLQNILGGWTPPI